MTAFHIPRRLLAKNAAINISGQVISSLVAVVTIPYVVHRLGVERFGILSIAWLLLGYAGVFDLGLGRATTKYVAEALGKGERERVPSIVWTSLSFQLVLGLVAALGLAEVTPLLVGRVLNISPNVIEEARGTCYQISFAVPMAILAANLRGALEASQRFDLVTIVRIPVSSLSVLMPALGVFWGFGLPGIIRLLIVVIAASAIAYLLLCFSLYPEMRRVCPQARLLRSLLHFGGWTSVCNLMIPVLNSLERFMLGALVSVAAVGYYTAPGDLVSRLQIIPGNVGIIMFPAYAALAAQERGAAARLYASSLKFLALIMAPIAFVVMLFARNILELWLGAPFAEKGERVLQILALGILLNAIAQMPAHLLDGLGRPDLRAKILAFYVCPYAALSWLFIKWYGINGAALAWTARAGLELVLFLFVAHANLKTSFSRPIRACLLGASSACAILVASAAGLGYWVADWRIRAAAGSIVLVSFGLVGWYRILDSSDRTGFSKLLKRRDDLAHCTTASTALLDGTTQGAER